MASTRLPGKVLLDLNGKTVLSHVLERCAAITEAQGVCCAIPDGADCDAIAIEAKRAGSFIFRGSETDVLDRYYRAARSLDAEVVLRVTSDCPLIDPNVCDEVLRLRASVSATFACNNQPPTWPHGLDCEAFPMAWLERAASEASSPFEREHVGPFMRNHPQAQLVNFAATKPGLTHLRWTLDTPDDLRFMRAVFARLPASRDAWDYRVPLAIVEADPALTALNAPARP